MSYYHVLFCLQICRALAYIHNCIGICHRDIKPQNLLVRFFPKIDMLFDDYAFILLIVFGPLSLQIHVFFVLFLIGLFIGKHKRIFFVYFQVNPHTHQLKLCDFGSAKVLVSHINIILSLLLLILHITNLKKSNLHLGEAHKSYKYHS